MREYLQKRPLGKASVCYFFISQQLDWFDASPWQFVWRWGGGGHSLGLLIPVWPAGMTNLLGSNHHWLCIESSAHNGGRTKPAHHWKAFYYVMHPCSVMRVTCSSRLTAGWSVQEYCFLQSDKTPPHSPVQHGATRETFAGVNCILRKKTCTKLQFSFPFFLIHAMFHIRDDLICVFLSLQHYRVKAEGLNITDDWKGQIRSSQNDIRRCNVQYNVGSVLISTINIFKNTVNLERRYSKTLERTWMGNSVTFYSMG